MKVFTCTNFSGQWPVGVAAVIVAPDKASAANLLAAELERRGLKFNKNTTIEPMKLWPAAAYILNDGNY